MDLGTVKEERETEVSSVQRGSLDCPQNVACASVVVKEEPETEFSPVQNLKQKLPQDVEPASSPKEQEPVPELVIVPSVKQESQFEELLSDDVLTPKVELTIEQHSIALGEKQPHEHESQLGPCNTENLKMKWIGLRDYYRKELKKLKKPRSGNRADCHSTFKWTPVPLVSSLNDSMSTRPRTTNLESTRSDDALESAQGTTENAEKDSITEFSPRVKHSQDITQSPKLALRKSNMPRQAQKEKGADLYRQSMLKLEAKRLKFLERKVAEDEDEDFLFFKSMLKDLKSIPRERRMLLKYKFQEVLYKEIASSSMSNSPTPLR